MGVNSKKKGNIWENRFKNWLTDRGFKAWRDPQSGGGTREKSDVGNNENLHFEVKAGKQVPKKVYDFYDQAQKDATKTHNIPYVIMHRDGRPEDEFMVMMNVYDWFDLWQKAQEPKTMGTMVSKEEKYKLERAKQALIDALKIFK